MTDQDRHQDQDTDVETLLDDIEALREQVRGLHAEREDMRQALRDCITHEKDRARRDLNFCRRRFDFINRIAMDTLIEGEKWEV